MDLSMSLALANAMSDVATGPGGADDADAVQVRLPDDRLPMAFCTAPGVLRMMAERVGIRFDVT